MHKTRRSAHVFHSHQVLLLWGERLVGDEGQAHLRVPGLILVRPGQRRVVDRTGLPDASEVEIPEFTGLLTPGAKMPARSGLDERMRADCPLVGLWMAQRPVGDAYRRSRRHSTAEGPKYGRRNLRCVVCGNEHWEGNWHLEPRASRAQQALILCESPLSSSGARRGAPYESTTRIGAY